MSLGCVASKLLIYWIFIVFLIEERSCEKVSWILGESALLECGDCKEKEIGWTLHGHKIKCPHNDQLFIDRFVCVNDSIDLLVKQVTEADRNMNITCLCKDKELKTKVYITDCTNVCPCKNDAACNSTAQNTGFPSVQCECLCDLAHGCYIGLWCQQINPSLSGQIILFGLFILLSLLSGFGVIKMMPDPKADQQTVVEWKAKQKHTNFNREILQSLKQAEKNRLENLRLAKAVTSWGNFGAKSAWDIDESLTASLAEDRTYKEDISQDTTL